jgi:nitrite reductase (NO-forming)
MHVANGMYGLILVEPKGGFPKVDHEYYVMQGEFYTKGKNGEVGEQPFSMEKAIDERPEYIVFNGSVGSTLGNTALEAKVGETVRLFVGNGGPNLTSSFHVIGEVFDRAWVGGNTSVIETNLQTATVAPGGSAIVDLTVNVPGTFVLVDHALSRAFNRGALAQLKVSGEEDKSIYSGKIRDEVYLPEGAGIKTADLPGRVTPPAHSKEERIKRGELVYKTNCAACHQSAGQGIAGAFPPLAKSDFLNADKIRAIETVTGGRQGKLVVNGQEFNGVMPEWTLADEEIANLLTFIYNSWDNSGKEVSPEEVKTHRAKKGGSPE